MGSGKSSALLYSEVERQRFEGGRGCLVIAPIRVANLTWPLEIEKWDFTEGARCLNLRPMLVKPKNWEEQCIQDWTKREYKRGGYQFYVINYENLARFSERWLMKRKTTEIPFDHVVFDEITKAKQHNSVTIETFRKVIKHFDYRTGLTGTVMPNNYIDLFAQVRLIDGGEALGNFITHYRREHFYKEYEKSFVWALRPGHQEIIQQKIAHLTITLRAEDHSKVPEVDHRDHHFKLPPSVMSNYKLLEKEGLMNKDPIQALKGLSDDDDDLIEAGSAAVIVQKLRQICGGAVYDDERNVHVMHDHKIKLLKKVIKKETKGPVLIATSFTHEMDRILKAIPKAQKFREDLLVPWNRNKVPIMVADFRSISHGLNLQEGGAYHTIWFSPTYSFEGFDQWNARLARMGQELRVQIHRLIAEGTIEEAIYDVLREKEGGLKGLLLALTRLERMRQLDL